MESSKSHDPIWSSRATMDVNNNNIKSNDLRSMIPMQPGESHEYERPTSAPPPPGFASGADERNKLEHLWGNSGSHTPLKQQQQQQHNSQATNNSQRNSSFGNLAAVLGAGLAESMEDATREASSYQPTTHHHADDLNYHRQSRHAAARLVGTSPDNDLVYNTTNSNKAVAPSNDQHQQASGLFGSMYASSRDNTTNNGGFPSNLSTQPQRKTPVETINAGGSERRNNNYMPQSKDIGMNVVEPEGTTLRGISGIVSHRFDAKTQPIFQPQQQQQQQPYFQLADHFPTTTQSGGGGELWQSANAREFKPAGQQQQRSYSYKNSPDRVVDSSDANSSISDSAAGTEMSARQAESDLRHFLWDLDRNSPSRTIAILRVSWLPAPNVRQACEAYGVVETFRSEFSHKGIYFCSFYDIRSAQYAAVELESVLQRMLIQQRSSDEVIVRYCLPLNSSSQLDDSEIIVSNLPPTINENALVAMLDSYGAVRSVLMQTHGSFVVEFQNVQDTKQALLELESSQPWGADVSVETGVRNPMERKRGRELLAMLGRWRQNMGRAVTSHAEPQQQHYSSPGSANQKDPWSNTDVPGTGSLSTAPHVAAPPDLTSFRQGGVGGYAGQLRPVQPAPQPQLVLGPDGRYQVVMHQSQSLAQFGGQGAQALQPLGQPQQQIIQGPDGQLYVAAVPLQYNGNVYAPHNAQLRPAQFIGQGGQNGNFVNCVSPVVSNTPYYTHVVSASDNNSAYSGRSGRSSHNSQRDDGDNRHLTLDLEAVEHDLDTRTSLMVRNIPNKYTQQMLLNEFQENGHGAGLIDFFYLPIDFKNRCNRGYAFINFVDYKDILTFHRQYFGKHWRTFNSDKICDITYARIQGKAAMLKRFENSALMEKDDEYKPLVFVSDGPNKGQRLPFPGPGAV